MRPESRQPSRPIHARLAAVALVAIGSAARGAAPEPLPIDQGAAAAFQARCLTCHSSARKEGDLDLEQPLSSPAAAIAADADVWERVLENIANGEMPPKKAPPLSADEKRAVEAWVTKALDAIAERTAGDPGPVSLRRLSNMEYTYTIRDLTGIDSLDPVRGLRAQQQGSTNQAAAQGGMSESLLAKYLDAATEVASHAVLLPDGIRFAAAAQSQDWINETLRSIRGIYGRSTFKGRGSTTVEQGITLSLGGDGRLALDRYLAALQGGSAAGLSPKYLGILRAALEGGNPSPLFDPLRAKLRAGGLREADVDQLRNALWRFSQVGHIGRVGGPKAWQEPVNPLGHDVEVRLPLKPAQGGGDVIFYLVAGDAGDGAEGDVALWENPRIVARGKPDVPLGDLRTLARQQAQGSGGAGGPGGDYGLDPGLFGRTPGGTALAPTSFCMAAPAIVEIRVPASLCGNDAAFVARVRLLDPAADGSVQAGAVSQRPAAAVGLLDPKMSSSSSGGSWSDTDIASRFELPVLVSPTGTRQKRFEAWFDEFRAVFPIALCYPQIVPTDEVVTLMLYHREDEHLRRLILDDSQRAELDRLWAELTFVSEAPLKEVDTLEQIIQFATQDANPKVFEPLRDPYRKKAEEFRRLRSAAEPRHVQAVVDLAARAWRRPLGQADRARLETLYGTLRSEGLDHPGAVRMLIARVLTAPEFLYRGERPAPGGGAVPVNDWELATRLSYFLWSSLPDDELRGLAAAGRLRDPEVLSAQARRMLADPRVGRLGTEFGCEYLHVADVATLEEKSETHFPTFKAVRGAMQEEVARFFTDLFQADRSVLSLLDADHTFVNGPLAAHYAIPGADPRQTEWRRVDGMKAAGRGGVLGFAATQARQAGASRTSPILRGTWVWEVVLGQKLPKPPQGVPQLPEEAPTGLTERQLTERHSSDERCASCHRRIDPFGFALEGFDAIGRGRRQDAAGLPIDTQTALADGTSLAGLDGLRGYLLGSRRDEVVRQFCRKLLMYAVGRPLQVSDKSLLDTLVRDLGANDHKVGIAIDRIVRSPQFREVRGREYAGSASNAPRP